MRNLFLRLGVAPLSSRTFILSPDSGPRFSCGHFVRAAHARTHVSTHMSPRQKSVTKNRGGLGHQPIKSRSGSSSKRYVHRKMKQERRFESHHDSSLFLSKWALADQYPLKRVPTLKTCSMNAKQGESAEDPTAVHQHPHGGGLFCLKTRNRPFAAS